MREPSSNTSKSIITSQHQFQPHHQQQQQQQQQQVVALQQPQLQQQPVGGRAPSGGPPPPAGPGGPQQGGHTVIVPQQGGQVVNPQQNNLSLGQLQDMAMRQGNQIEAQQQMLVAKEQRLKYLRQQDFKQNQMAAEYERLRRLREKVETQEMKLRKLRALRQGNNVQQQPRPTSTSVSTDLEAIRSLFTEKEKELGLAVHKVDELTHQLDDLRNGRVNSHFPPQMVELERLRRELAYRKQLNEQQNNMISQQRDQLSRGHEEIAKMDNRILELQERLTKKRCMNQQLANQISAATSAKQAQLRAIQQGMMNRNKNKPVSTVEPFQRQAQAQALEQNSTDQDNKNNDPKYQTLPYNTKFGPPSQQHGQQQQQNQPANMAMMKKIEALKQEKENNNSGNGNHDLPSPPPQLPMQHRIARPDHLGNYELAIKPISSVAPVNQVISDSSFGSIGINNTLSESSASSNGIDSSPMSTAATSTSTPSLPPKPTSSTTADRSPSPPPYVPAPPPVSSNAASIAQSPNDSTITVVKGNNGYPPSSSSAVGNGNNLSVSTHPAEEGTSVDDDMPSASENESEDNSSRGSNLMVRPPPSNVHISINRRIEMPPAFHFPEDGTPPSDLVGVQDYPDNAGANGGNFYTYQDFEHLSAEEKYQLFGSSAGNLVGHPDSVIGHHQDQEQLDEDLHEDHTFDIVPDVVESDIRDHMPPGIIKKPVSSSSGSSDEKELSRSRRISFDPLALLLDASLEGELELVKKTAREVPNPSAANDEGITALHNAICAGHYDIVKFLVEFGCDVNAQDSDGWTPLHCAASCNNLEMVRFLVEHGACIFATTLSDRETAAEKCEEEEEGYRGCYDYLCNIQENLGLMNNTEVFAVYDYKAHRSDELDFGVGAKLSVLRRGDDFEKEWWWCKISAPEQNGYVPRNLLGLYPRVTPLFTLSIIPELNEKNTSDQDEDVTMSS